VKLKGEASFRLADGSPISQASTDEYNPYLVRMPDGYLMLVFGSDRSCGGCTTGAHNIFIARSTSTYGNAGVLPAFNTPAVLTLATIAINQASPISFVAASSNFGLRIFFNNSAGVIRYVDFTPTASTFDSSNGGSAIMNSVWQTATIVGINSAGTQLFAKTSNAVYAIDPFALNPTLTAMGSLGLGVQSVAQVSASYSGSSDSFIALSGNQFLSASFTNIGSALTNLNSAATASRLSLRSATILQSTTSAGEIIAVSGVETGSSKQDLFLFESVTPSGLWSGLSAKPASTGIPTGGTQGTISTTATRVYGQYSDLSCNAQARNSGSCTGPGPITSQNMFRAQQPIIVDGGLYVGDQQHNRALFYPGTSTTATRVYCQNDNMASGTFGGVPSTVQCRGNGGYGNVASVWADATGVYVVDIEANRVPFHLGTSTNASTGRIYGQNGSFTTFSANNPSISGGGMNFPDHVYTDSSGVYISDASNNRVLHFPGTSTIPDRVYGQNGSFTTNGTSTSANGLSGPRGVWGDGEGLYIADLGNSRVLYFPGTSTTATRVYGQQGSFTSNTPDLGGVSADSLDQPWLARPYAGGVFIADWNNHRVLYYSGTSTTASRVWGQANNMNASTVNNGGLGPNSLNFPTGVDVDATGLYIADNTNNRVLFFPRQ